MVIGITTAKSGSAFDRTKIATFKSREYCDFSHRLSTVSNSDNTLLFSGKVTTPIGQLMGLPRINDKRLCQDIELIEAGLSDDKLLLTCFGTRDKKFIARVHRFNNQATLISEVIDIVPGSRPRPKVIFSLSGKEVWALDNDGSAEREQSCGVYRNGKLVTQTARCKNAWPLPQDKGIAIDSQGQLVIVESNGTVRRDEVKFELVSDFMANQDLKHYAYFGHNLKAEARAETNGELIVDGQKSGLVFENPTSLTMHDSFYHIGMLTYTSWKFPTTKHFVSFMPEYSNGPGLGKPTGKYRAVFDKSWQKDAVLWNSSTQVLIQEKSHVQEGYEVYTLRLIDLTEVLPDTVVRNSLFLYPPRETYGLGLTFNENGKFFGVMNSFFQPVVVTSGGVQIFERGVEVSWPTFVGKGDIAMVINSPRENPPKTIFLQRPSVKNPSILDARQFDCVRDLKADKSRGILSFLFQQGCAVYRGTYSFNDKITPKMLADPGAKCP